MRSKMRVSGSSLIELLNEQEHNEFLNNFHKKNYQKGHMVSAPDITSDDVMIVSSGRLRVFLSYEGREFTLYFLEQGDIFTTHTRAFIQAVKASVVLLTPVKAFRQKLVSHPEIALLMTGILGEMLGSSWDVIEGIIFHDAKTRLIAFIISLGKEQGRLTEQGIAFDCELTMEDISLIIGSTRQTTSSLFNVMIKDGDILRLEKNKYAIPDLQALSARLAEYKK